MDDSFNSHDYKYTIELWICLDMSLVELWICLNNSWILFLDLFSFLLIQNLWRNPCQICQPCIDVTTLASYMLRSFLELRFLTCQYTLQCVSDVILSFLFICTDKNVTSQRKAINAINCGTQMMSLRSPRSFVIDL